MRATNDERREVARRLREVKKTGFYSTWCRICMVVCGPECPVGCDEDEMAVDAAKRLADLIEPEPERTCRVKSVKEIDDYDGIIFGEAVFTCGHSAEFVYCRPDYCPTCGARVVD